MRKKYKTECLFHETKQISFLSICKLCLSIYRKKFKAPGKSLFLDWKDVSYQKQLRETFKCEITDSNARHDFSDKKIDKLSFKEKNVVVFLLPKAKSNFSIKK